MRVEHPTWNLYDKKASQGHFEQKGNKGPSGVLVQTEEGSVVMQKPTHHIQTSVGEGVAAETLDDVTETTDEAAEVAVDTAEDAAEVAEESAETVEGAAAELAGTELDVPLRIVNWPEALPESPNTALKASAKWD